MPNCSECPSCHSPSCHVFCDSKDNPCSVNGRKKWNTYFITINNSKTVCQLNLSALLNGRTYPSYN